MLAAPFSCSELFPGRVDRCDGSPAVHDGDVVVQRVKNRPGQIAAILSMLFHSACVLGIIPLSFPARKPSAGCILKN